MRLKRLILATASAFTLLAVQTTWGATIEERAYAIKVESNLKSCMNKADNDVAKKLTCNSDALEKLHKWHQGTFYFVPWHRKVSDIKHSK